MEEVQRKAKMPVKMLHPLYI